MRPGSPQLNLCKRISLGSRQLPCEKWKLSVAGGASIPAGFGRIPDRVSTDNFCSDYWAACAVDLPNG